MLRQEADVVDAAVLLLLGGGDLGLPPDAGDLTAIVTVADDGGGSGVLREDLGMPPPGDIRSCMDHRENTSRNRQHLAHPGHRLVEGGGDAVQRGQQKVAEGLPRQPPGWATGPVRPTGT